MTPDECRKESDKAQGAWGTAGYDCPDLQRAIIELANSRALWEIAAQLAELNQHVVYAYRAYSPSSDS